MVGSVTHPPIASLATNVLFPVHITANAYLIPVLILQLTVCQTMGNARMIPSAVTPDHTAMAPLLDSVCNLLNSLDCAAIHRVIHNLPVLLSFLQPSLHP